MLLSMAERRLGIAERLARCFPDARDPTRIIHTLNNGANSLMQLSTEPEMRGRVMAIRVVAAIVAFAFENIDKTISDGDLLSALMVDTWLIPGGAFSRTVAGGILPPERSYSCRYGSKMPQPDGRSRVRASACAMEATWSS
jgi:hypothetical protein